MQGPALLPIAVAAAIVLPSSLLVGLPIWLFLRWRNWASPPLLAMIGSFAGFFILWLVVFAMGGQANVMVAFLAAFSGGVTGYFWGMGTSEDAEA